MGWRWWESYAIRKVGELFPGLVVISNFAPDGVEFWACSLRDAVFGSGHDDSRVDKLGYSLGGRILLIKTLGGAPLIQRFRALLGWKARFRVLLMGF